jgi:hypothetical protein
VRTAHEARGRLTATEFEAIMTRPAHQAA